ncbi:hypothetical protein BDP27DRAFT_1424486 [Rhodocollybia butyracea]|uniref:SHSP domain-containing protein n=1 Tax=Rhodocollybia butyracea TaxID=206335 RepID=A0A9P5PLV4_9AGAR|nr:hypothetical protein BDP27DRAFT_1424486 [Rhodocollybia butyracea]
MSSLQQSAVPPPPYPTLHMVSGSLLPPASAAPSAAFKMLIEHIHAKAQAFYQPRMDCYYDSGSGILRVYIELPGVHQENLHITLVNSSINHGKNIVIWGFTLPLQSYLRGMPISPTSSDSILSPVAQPASSTSGNKNQSDSRLLLQSSAPQLLGLGIPPLYILRERKYGEFFRQLPVPADIKVTNIRTSLDGGVLRLSVALGMPLTQEQINAS